VGHNFLDIQKERKDFSNAWRNVFFLVVLFGLFGGGMFAFSTYVPNLSPLASAFDEETNQTLVPQEVGGGDVTVDPPVVLPPIPELIGEVPNAENFSAQTMIVKDHETGVVLYGKNVYVQHPIASITKLMSALVLREHDLDWATSTVVTSADVVDTHMYAGDTYTIEDLWRSSLVASSNKAIMTLVEAIEWSQEAFVERMNQKAVELGMTDSHFVEPTGLDSDNVSTASDISLLLNEALADDKIVSTLLTPEHTLYSAERKNRHSMWNTNWLLLGWIPHTLNLHGGKTGYIDASGYNFTSRVSDDLGRLLDIVVLGTNSHEARFTETKDIANAVYEVYQWPNQE
jgi:D-alanyl-D-alanine carboxypeptidase